MDTKHSTVGIASFIVAVCASCLLLGAFVVAGFLQHGHPPGDYPGKELVGLAIIALLMAEAVAIVLGIISVFQKECKKLFGILGLSISGIAMFGTLCLMVIGLIVMMLRR